MKNCYCKEILNMPDHIPVVIHLTGCPKECEYTKEYDKMKWYKRLWYTNPHLIYVEHLKATIWRA